MHAFADAVPLELGNRGEHVQLEPAGVEVASKAAEATDE